MKRKKIICLDAGHGGNDPGTVANGMNEAIIALEVVGLLKKRLENAGLEVMLTRQTADERPSLSERAQLANKHLADYFISIHVNAGRGTGAETFYFRNDSDRSRKSEALAHYINNAYAAAMGLRNRGAKPDTQTHVGTLTVLRHTIMPAILVELAFIDSPANNPDVDILRRRRFDMAEELETAIRSYLRIEEERAISPAPSLPEVAPTLDIIS